MAAATEPSQGVGCVARRAVLLGLGSAGLVALAGCSGGDDRGTGSANGPSPGTAEQPGASAQPDLPAQPSAEPSYEPWPDSEGTDGGLIKTTEVPVGGGVLVSDYIVVQPRPGVFKAYDATCPHQGVTVDPPLTGSDQMVCPGHNSKYRVSDGSRISGPAPRGLRQIAVKVTDGYVVTA